MNKDNKRMQFIERRPDQFMPVQRGASQLAAGVYDLIDTSGADDMPAFCTAELTTDEIIPLQIETTDQMLAEIETFWGKGLAFSTRGLLHKRGYLIHGQPGTGKSSLIYAVAEQIVKRGGIVIYAPVSIDLLSVALHQLREVEPVRPVVVVLEDVDQYIRRYETELLALLDGEDQVEHIVYVATTNHMDRLPATIKNRPSRFDKIVEVRPLNYEQRLEFFRRKTLHPPVEEYTSWAEATDGLTVAQLREIVIGVEVFETPFTQVLDRLKSMGADTDLNSD